MQVLCDKLSIEIDNDIINRGEPVWVVVFRRRSATAASLVQATGGLMEEIEEDAHAATEGLGKFDVADLRAQLETLIRARAPEMDAHVDYEEAAHQAQLQMSAGRSRSAAVDRAAEAACFAAFRGDKTLTRPLASGELGEAEIRSLLIWEAAVKARDPQLAWDDDARRFIDYDEAVHQVQLQLSTGKGRKLDDYVKKAVIAVLTSAKEAHLTEKRRAGKKKQPAPLAGSNGAGSSGGANGGGSNVRRHFVVQVFAHLNDERPFTLWPASNESDGTGEEADLAPEEDSGTSLTLDEHTSISAVWAPRRCINLTQQVRQGKDADGQPLIIQRRLTLQAADNARHDLWLSGLMSAQSHERSNAQGTAERSVQAPGEEPGDDMLQALSDLKKNLEAFEAQVGMRVELCNIVRRIKPTLELNRQASVEGPLLRRLSIVFLQLTADVLPNKSYRANVPRPNALSDHGRQHSQGQDPRWLRYTKAYAMWMLTFASETAPFAVARFPQPPVARVRAIFLRCDLREALKAFLPQRQEQKLKRLEDLVSSMLQWATTFEGHEDDDGERDGADFTDPTFLLFRHLGFPEEWQQSCTAAQVAGFVHEHRPAKIESFLQVRLLADPRHFAQANELSMHLEQDGSEAARLEAVRRGESAKVDRLFEKASRIRQAEGLEITEAPISFQPFDDQVGYVKGPHFWPLTKLEQPVSQAALLVKLTGSHFYVRRRLVLEKLAKESFEGDGTAMSFAMCEQVLLLTLSGGEISEASSGGEIAQAATRTGGHEDAANRRMLLYVWGSELFARVMKALRDARSEDEAVEDTASLPLLQACDRLMYRALVVCLRPGAMSGFFNAWSELHKQAPRDASQLLARFSSYFIDLLKRAAFDAHAAGEAYVGLRPSMRSSPGYADRMEIFLADTRAHFEELPLIALGRAAQLGCAILGLVQVLMSLGDLELLCKVMGDVTKASQLFAHAASALPDGQDPLDVSDAGGSGSATSFLGAVVDCLFGKGEFQGLELANTSKSVALYHGFYEVMTGIMRDMKGHFWHADVFFLFSSRAFSTEDGARGDVERRLTALFGACLGTAAQPEPTLSLSENVLMYIEILLSAVQPAGTGNATAKARLPTAMAERHVATYVRLLIDQACVGAPSNRDPAQMPDATSRRRQMELWPLFQSIMERALDNHLNGSTLLKAIAESGLLPPVADDASDSVGASSAPSGFRRQPSGLVHQPSALTRQLSRRVERPPSDRGNLSQPASHRELGSPRTPRGHLAQMRRQITSSQLTAGQPPNLAHQASESRRAQQAAARQAEERTLDNLIYLLRRVGELSRGGGDQRPFEERVTALDRLFMALLQIVRSFRASAAADRLRKPFSVVAALAFKHCWGMLEDGTPTEKREDVVRLLVESELIHDTFRALLLRHDSDELVSREYFWSTKVFEIFSLACVARIELGSTQVERFVHKMPFTHEYPR